MDAEILQIAAELSRLQSRLLTLLVEKTAPPPPPEEVTPEPEPRTVPHGARLTFLKNGKGAPEAVLAGVREAGFKLSDISGGVAYKKDFFKREIAWKSARRVWKWLQKGGHVPKTPYNTLRKAHTKDWYIWVHDPNMEKKTWIRDRIQEREAGPPETS